MTPSKSTDFIYAREWQFSDDIDDLINADGFATDPFSAGSGFDVVAYAGDIDDYVITQNFAQTVVTSKLDPQDTDVWVNVEGLVFDETRLSIEHDTTYGQIASLYDKLFDRQADLDGFQYWADAAENGVSLGSIAVSMMKSDEYTQKSGKSFDPLDTDEQIETLYEELLERSADKPGLDYWVSEVEAGGPVDAAADEMMLPTFAASRSFMEPSLWNFFM